jgi:hypothetical protein
MSVVRNELEFQDTVYGKCGLSMFKKGLSDFHVLLVFWPVDNSALCPDLVLKLRSTCNS